MNSLLFHLPQRICLSAFIVRAINIQYTGLWEQKFITGIVRNQVRNQVDHVPFLILKAGIDLVLWLSLPPPIPGINSTPEFILTRN
jgi:hypothetical protein